MLNYTDDLHCVVQVAYHKKQVQLEDILECIRDAGFEADSLSAMPAEASGKVRHQALLQRPLHLPERPVACPLC